MVRKILSPLIRMAYPALVAGSALFAWSAAKPSDLAILGVPPLSNAPVHWKPAYFTERVRPSPTHFLLQ